MTITISDQQELDEKLQRNLHDNSAYSIGRVTKEQYKLIFRNDKICVPSPLTHPIMDWYHNCLIYPGTDRLFATISQHFY